MKAFAVLLFLHGLFLTNGYSQEKRALLVGIDRYSKEDQTGRWKDLEGCVNDVQAFSEILVGRFGFGPEGIRVLANEEASRAGILARAEELLDRSNSGDLALIYYSGHGSQVKNSLSVEEDRLDETIVPADSREGAPDIRDKELAALFNRFAAKGVILTVVFDCCHSGSLSRGTLSGVLARSRFMAPDPVLDAHDPSRPPAPEKAGVLILSASQDYQSANEQTDGNGTPHGAFSLALIQAIMAMPPETPVAELFASTRAILKNNGWKQEPVLAAIEPRKQAMLLGKAGSVPTGSCRVAILGIEDGQVVVQGGFALGLYPGSELESVKPMKVKTRLRVTESLGVNRSVAHVIEGTIGQVKPGDLFELKNWCQPPQSALKLFIPDPIADSTGLRSILSKVGDLSGRFKLASGEMPGAAGVYTLFRNGNIWNVGAPDGTVYPGGETLDPKSLPGKVPEGAQVFVSLPPLQRLVNQLKIELAGKASVLLTSRPEESDYLVAGVVEQGQAAYGLVHTRAWISGLDSGAVLPLRTDFYPVGGEADAANAATSLADKAMKLSRVKAWLSLQGPPDDGRFPFSFALVDHSRNRLITNGQCVYESDEMGMVFMPDSGKVQNWDGVRRFVYVFVIDSQGRMDLAFPLNGSVENRFPVPDENGKVPERMFLGSQKLFRVSKPLGVDTYLMLVTREPIPDPGQLNQAGVRSRGNPGAPPGAWYQGLLDMNAGTTRGHLTTPMDWGIRKLVVRSR